MAVTISTPIPPTSHGAFFFFTLKHLDIQFGSINEHDHEGLDKTCENHDPWITWVHAGHRVKNSIHQVMKIFNSFYAP